MFSRRPLKVTVTSERRNGVEGLRGHGVPVAIREESVSAWPIGQEVASIWAGWGCRERVEQMELKALCLSNHGGDGVPFSGMGKIRSNRFGEKIRSSVLDLLKWGYHGNEMNR